MNNLVCLKHPTYKGKEAPTLSCKSCCIIFVNTVKEEAKKNTPTGSQLMKEWFEEKKKPIL